MTEEVPEEERSFYFLKQIIRKLDEPGQAEYTTTLPELHGILSELAPSTDVMVMGQPNMDGNDDLLAVKIELAITVSRTEFGANN